jgi:hypothetical protein
MGKVLEEHTRRYTPTPAKACEALRSSFRVISLNARRRAEMLSDYFRIADHPGVCDQLGEMVPSLSSDLVG